MQAGTIKLYAVTAVPTLVGLSRSDVAWSGELADG